MELIYFGDHGPSAPRRCAHGGGIATSSVYNSAISSTNHYV